MRPIRESVRIHIRRLYFTHHLTFEQIAERLGEPIESVRNALVLDGGVRDPQPTGPFTRSDS